MTKLTRSDCKRDNVMVRCPRASLLGFGQGYCKRGNWLMYETSDGYHHAGRAIGRVVCEGETFIEVAQASLEFSHAYIRWIEPERVREIRPEPPRRVFEFFSSEDWKPETVFAALEYGVSDLHDQLKTD